MIPPYRALIDFLGQPVASGEAPFVTSEHRLKQAFQYFLSLMPFDDENYYDTDSELAKALVARAPGSAQDHFLAHGYFEGRSSNRAEQGEVYDLSRYRDRHPAPYKDRVLRAMKYLDEQEYADAERELLEATKAFPVGLNARRLLCKIYMNTGRPRRAGREIQAIAPAYRTAADWINLAKVAQVFGFNILRLGYLREAIAFSPDFARKNAPLVGEALMHVGHVSEAYRLLHSIPPNELGGNGIAMVARLGSLRLEARLRLRSLAPMLRATQCTRLAFSEAALLLARLDFKSLANRLVDLACNKKFDDGTSDIEKILTNCLDALVLTVGLDNAHSLASSMEFFKAHTDSAALLRAYLMIRAGKCREAIELIRSREASGNSVARLSSLARALVYVGNVDEGLAACDRLSEIEPRSGGWATIAFSAAIDSGSLCVQTVRKPAKIRKRDYTSIPTTIVQYWNNPNPPDEVLAVIAGWRQRNPNFTHTLYSESAARLFIKTFFDAETLDAFDYCHHPAMQADLFRLAYLVINGGVYVDTDNACTGTLSDMLCQMPDKHFIVELKSHMSLNNAFIACTPNHPVLTDCFTLARKNVLLSRAAGSRADIARDTGPGVTNDVIARLLLQKDDRSRMLIQSVGLVTEQDIRAYVVELNMAYKASPSGNWRIA